MNKICGNCKYWQKDDDNSYWGICNNKTISNKVVSREDIAFAKDFSCSECKERIWVTELK